TISVIRIASSTTRERRTSNRGGGTSADSSGKRARIDALRSQEQEAFKAYVPDSSTGSSIPEGAWTPPPSHARTSAMCEFKDHFDAVANPPQWPEGSDAGSGTTHWTRQ